MVGPLWTPQAHDNQCMVRMLLLAVMASNLLTACSPALNWREVRIGDAGVKAMLPCKPDHAQRKVALAGRSFEMEMLGCESGAALFAISRVNVESTGALQEVQASWQASSLAAMRAEGSQGQAHQLKHAAKEPAPLRLAAQGSRPDGRPIALQALWFAQGHYLYHAAVYAEKISVEMSGPFFSGLELP